MTPEDRASLIEALSNKGIRCACVALVDGGMITVDMKELMNVGKPA